MVAAYSFLGSPEGYPTIDKYIFRHKQLLLTTPVGTGVTLAPAWSNNNAAKSTQINLPAAQQQENIGFRYQTSTGEIQEIMNVTLNPGGGMVTACTAFNSPLDNRNACIPAISANDVGACRIVFYKRNF